jgi:hypothetical protein
MNRTIAIAALAAGAGWATTAWADSPNIKGSYAFAGSAACLVAPGGIPSTPTGTPLANPTPGVAQPNSGFNANFQPKDSGPSSTSFNRSFAVEGIRTFDGQGNGHVKGTAVGVLNRPTPGPNGYPHFAPSASATEFSFDFTYTVDGHGGWTATMVPGSYTETFTSGPRGPQAGPPATPGQTVTVDAIPPVTGVISNDGKTLVAAHLEPAVETHTYSNGDVWPEVCHRERVFIKISDDDHDGDHDH